MPPVQADDQFAAGIVGGYFLNAVVSGEQVGGIGGPPFDTAVRLELLKIKTFQKNSLHNHAREFPYFAGESLCKKDKEKAVD